jgi:CRP/FNR family cyclic AMP-dependent transcriptional regulator
LTVKSLAASGFEDAMRQVTSEHGVLTRAVSTNAQESTPPPLSLHAIIDAPDESRQRVILERRRPTRMRKAQEVTKPGHQIDRYRGARKNQMREVLDACARTRPSIAIPADETLLREGQRSGVLYVLEEGEVEISKGEYQVAVISQPGTVLGDISVLLDIPHTATVKTTVPCRFYVIDAPLDFLRTHPEAALDIAQLLAERLHAMTTYLVDLKKQFESSEDHFGMVDEVLETLSYAPRSNHAPGSKRDPDPDVT